MSDETYAWDARPDSRGEWMIRLDMMSGYLDPTPVIRRAVETGSIGGLPVESVFVDPDGYRIKATNGWVAHWDPGSREWIGPSPIPWCQKCSIPVELSPEGELVHVRGGGSSMGTSRCRGAELPGGLLESWVESRVERID